MEIPTEENSHNIVFKYLALTVIKFVILVRILGCLSADNLLVVMIVNFTFSHFSRF